MNKILILLLVIVLSPCAASDVVTPTFKMLANKCFTGYTDFEGRRSSLQACFNGEGTHVFYYEKQYDPSGKPRGIYFDASVELTEHNTIILDSFSKVGEMTVSESGSDRLSLKGKFTYDGDRSGSVSLKQSSPKKTRRLQKEIMER